MQSQVFTSPAFFCIMKLFFGLRAACGGRPCTDQEARRETAMFSTLDMHILEILCEDARVTPREIAVMTGSDEAQVNLAINGL